MIYKNVPDYEKYIISEFGEIIKLPYVDSNGFFRNGRKIKSSKNVAGYYSVALINKGKIKKSFLHRVVASAFIPNIENKPQVNHKDSDKSNNHYKNLEWCTDKENKKHSAINKTNAFGDRNGRAKLNNEKVEKIRKLLIEKNHSHSEIAKLFGVNPTIISDIKLRKTWKHVS